MHGLKKKWTKVYHYIEYTHYTLAKKDFVPSIIAIINRNGHKIHEFKEVV